MSFRQFCFKTSDKSEHSTRWGYLIGQIGCDEFGRTFILPPPVLVGSFDVYVCIGPFLALIEASTPLPSLLLTNLMHRSCFKIFRTQVISINSWNNSYHHFLALNFEFRKTFFRHLHGFACFDDCGQEEKGWLKMGPFTCQFCDRFCFTYETKQTKESNWGNIRNRLTLQVLKLGTDVPVSPLRCVSYYRYF